MHREPTILSTPPPPAHIPSISIIVPAYNEEVSLPACLGALTSQNYKGSIEIIVVDNASTDATAPVAASHGCRVVYEPQKGYHHAVCRGFNEARGDIIACTDADTIVGTDWITRIAAILSRKDVVACGGIFRFHDGPLWIRLIGAVFGRFNYHIAGANMAMWREAYHRVGGFAADVNLGADVDISIRLKELGTVVIDRKLVVATSSRRFSSAFWQTIVTYYVNDLWLYLFRKPMFHSFTDYRTQRPSFMRTGRWAIPAAAFLCILGTGWLLELPLNPVLGQVFAKGNKVRAVALTFDDGPGVSTDAILAILKAYNAKATFFVIGKNARANPETLRRIVNDGHEIGNHTYSHFYQAAIDPPHTLRAELDSTEAVIQEITGSRPILFRPPHGWRNPWMIQECAKRGYNVVLWSVSSEDWLTKSPVHIKEKVFSHIHPGSIILFHDRLNTGLDKGMPHTVELLPAILDSLSRAGYSFVTVSELKSMPSDTAFYAHYDANLGHTIQKAIVRMRRQS
jgi:peptidoglycan/xylan/chitin deacetylase (PgdA/CDA1 family)